MARFPASTLNPHSFGFRIEILIFLAHGILAAYLAPSIDRTSLTPRSNDTAITSLAADHTRVLFSRDGYNCTSWSLGSHGAPAWEVEGFVFDRFWNADITPSEFRDEVDFTYNNTAINSVPYGCHDLGTRSNPRLDGSKSQLCESGPRDLTYFSFDYASMTLTLAQTWGCDAIDRHHANYFSATEKVVLPLKCAAANGNGTLCSVTGKVSVPMTNVVATLNSDPKDWDKGIERQGPG